MRHLILIAFSCLLLINCVFGGRIQPKTPNSFQSEGQLKATTTGPISLSIAPRFACTDMVPLSWSLTWSLFNISSNATIRLLGQMANSSLIYFVPDTGFFQIPPTATQSTYYQVTIVNSYGSAISALAGMTCQTTTPQVSSPNASSTIFTNTTSFPIYWNNTWFSGMVSQPLLNISFVDQVTQLNYTFTNLINNGSVNVNISSLAMPGSTYVVYMTAYGNNNAAQTLLGEFSTPFTIQPIPLNVIVNTSSLFFTLSSIPVKWIPSMGSNYTATLTFINLTNISQVFSPVFVPDNGSALVNLTSFGTSKPGTYVISVSSAFGSGISNLFTVFNTTGIALFNITPRFQCTDTYRSTTWNLTWFPYNTSAMATILMTGQTGYSRSYSVPDIGSFGIPTGDTGNTWTYFQIKITNGHGSATSELAYLQCKTTTPRVSSPTATSVIFTNTTNLQVVWDAGWFASGRPESILNLSFVDQVTQLNYSILNVTNAPGTVIVNVSALAMPPSSYVLYITGYSYGRPNDILFGEFSSLFVVRAIPLNVSVNALTLYSSSSFIPVKWTPSVNSSYLTKLTLINLSNPTQYFSNAMVPDIGNAFVSLSTFGPPRPGSYAVTALNTFGNGTSNAFMVVNTTQTLLVSLNRTSVGVGGNVNVSWIPSNALGLVNITLIRLSNGTNYPLFTNIADFGTLVATLFFAPGAYQIGVNSTLGNGISPLVEIISPLKVIAIPNNVSSSGGVSNITWSPFDTYQPTVNISIYLGNFSFTTFPVPNIGFFNLNVSTFGLFPNLFTVSVNSSVGSGNTTLNVYSSGNLAILAPTSASVIYNNSISTRVQWAPFYSATANANISLINQNSLQIYLFSVPNNGTAFASFTAVKIPAGTYIIKVVSVFGTGQTPPLVIRYANYLNISMPNATTNISNIGALNVSWSSTNLVGGDVSMFLYRRGNNGTTYGPFAAPDNGSTSLNLSLLTSNKAMSNSYESRINKIIAYSGQVNNIHVNEDAQDTDEFPAIGILAM